MARLAEIGCKGFAFRIPCDCSFDSRAVRLVGSPAFLFLILQPSAIQQLAAPRPLWFGHLAGCNPLQKPRAQDENPSGTLGVAEPSQSHFASKGRLLGIDRVASAF